MWGKKKQAPQGHRAHFPHFISLNVSRLSLSVRVDIQQVCLEAVIQTREATPQIDAHTWQHSEDRDRLL